MKRVTVLIAVLALFVAQFAVAGGQGEEAAEGEETEYRIGIVFDVGGRGDRSFNDSAYNGLRQLAEEYNGYIADDPDTWTSVIGLS